MQDRVKISGDLILASERTNNFRDKAFLTLQKDRDSVQMISSMK